MNENKKILIFEDEWATIKGSFDLANTYGFDDSLEFKQVSRSQDITYNSWRELYSAVFVDITLAKKTQMDGFSIVKKIQDENLIELEKVIVLTGNGRVKEKLEMQGIDTQRVKVIYKPISFDELTEVLKKVLS